MNDLQIFNYEGQEIRTVMVNDEPWWVLRDVCNVLGLGTPARVAERLDGDEVSQTHITDSFYHYHQRIRPIQCHLAFGQARSQTISQVGNIRGVTVYPQNGYIFHQKCG